MAIKVANAPVSWGIYEFEDVEPKFPYTRVLDEIAESGYRGTELGPYGYFSNRPGSAASRARETQSPIGVGLRSGRARCPERA